MRICFNQPAFLPWEGVFSRLMFSDKMVLLDDTQLARGFTYVNRNRIKGPSGPIWISVPLRRKGRGNQKIRDLEIYEKSRWVKNFLKTLQHFYGKSLYFQPVYSQIKEILDTPDDSFVHMAVSLLETTKNMLEIDKQMILQSHTGISGKGTSLLVALAKELGAQDVMLPYFSDRAIDCEMLKKEKIGVHFLRYTCPQYPQFWGSFQKKLSILDLLLCCGPQGRFVVEKGAVLYDRENCDRL